MKIIIYFFAIYAIVFAIKEADGAFGSINWLRRKLFANKYVGVFFYQLLSCPFCSGCWAGLITYLLSDYHFEWNMAILWFFGGGSISLFLDGVIKKLHS